MINWWFRLFKVISFEKALSLKLTHKQNIYGDPINWLGCRSLWVDRKGREYRVNILYIDNQKLLNEWKAKTIRSN